MDANPLSRVGLSWWRRAGWGPRSVALLGIGGAGLVALSLVPGPGLDAGWTRDFLMTVGSSIALLVPFYLVTRSLDRHLDRVAEDTAKQVREVRAETAQQVEQVRAAAAETSTQLTDQVDALRADVDRLEDAAGRVARRLEAEAAADEAAFDALRTLAPNRQAVMDALDRALQLGLVSATRPPRVSISPASHLYLGFELDTGDFAEEPLQLRVESLSGVVHDYVYWAQGRSGDDVLVEVGRALRKHTGEVLAAGAVLAGLADLLDAALTHPDRRPVVQLCPPQWLVCDWGIIRADAGPYGLKLNQLRSSTTVQRHMAEKPWVDMDSWEAAREAALALFPGGWGGQPRDDPWASPAGEPPF